MKKSGRITDLKTIHEFLSKKRIAVIGVSRDPKKFGSIIYDELTNRGYDTVPVNPHIKTFRNKSCSANIANISTSVDSAIILTPKKQTPVVVEETIRSGIKNIWIQQGSASPEIIDTINGFDGRLVTNRCILMFLEPVQSFHKLHRWISKIFNTYPE